MQKVIGSLSTHAEGHRKFEYIGSLSAHAEGHRKFEYTCRRS